MIENKHKITLTLAPDDDFRYSEALRTLRTNLMFSGSRVKNILITSTSPNEGKSTISFELARVFAESGKRTLYVDCDIRKSEFIKVHQISGKTVGLSEILTGQVPIEDGFYTDDNIPNLDMILAGPYAPNVTELFEDEMCDKLFQTIKEENYDIVILDTALDDDLLAEGYARDVIRSVQDARKAADLDITDRIALVLTVPAANVAKVEQFRDLIAHETLATSFEVKEGAELAVEVAKA